MSTQSPASAGPSGDNHPKATRKEATGDHAALIRYFLYKWKAKYPQGDYTFLPKDGAAAEKILKRAAHGNLDRAKHIVDEFFACEDPWIEEQRYTLSVLVNQINKFTSGESFHPVSRREGAKNAISSSQKTSAERGEFPEPAIRIPTVSYGRGGANGQR